MLTEVMKVELHLAGSTKDVVLFHRNLHLDFTLPNLSQENPEPTADWGKCGVPKVFKVKRGMHFCQRRYEIIPCKAHHDVATSCIIPQKVILNLEMLEIFS